MQPTPGKDPRLSSAQAEETDTIQLPVLQRFGEPPVITEAPPSVGGNPYSTEYLRPKAPRRSLDDMRKLSEEIKRARLNKKPTG
jgi:hypothetical protein